MRRFQSFLNLQRTLRLNEFVTRKNQYVTTCYRQITSLTPNETYYFKRSLAIKNGNACSRLLQMDDAWLLLSRTKKKKSQKKVEAEVVSFLGPCNTPNNLRTNPGLLWQQTHIGACRQRDIAFENSNSADPSMNRPSMSQFQF